MNEPRENKAKELFDDSVDRLDAATLSRLNQGRHAALDALQGSRPVDVWGRRIPAAGVAAAVLVAVMVVRGPNAVDLPNGSVTDFGILAWGGRPESL